MKQEAGLWIDRTKAVIVTITYEGVGIKSAQSNVEKKVCFSGILSQEGRVGNSRAVENLTSYYEDVRNCLAEADFIQIFGPGESKNQLEKSLRRAERGERIALVETVEKMTDRQIEARVWQRVLATGDLAA